MPGTCIAITRKVGKITRPSVSVRQPEAGNNVDWNANADAIALIQGVYPITSAPTLNVRWASKPGIVVY